jgi:hypothetical protein
VLLHQESKIVVPVKFRRFNKASAAGRPLRALPPSDPSERGGGGTDESAATHKS